MRIPAFALALLVGVTLGAVASTQGRVQPVGPAPDTELSDRIPEHIARLFAAGIVSLENLGF